MRIFYFITKSQQGGAQVVIYELLCAHKKKGDTVLVMAGEVGWLSQKTIELGFTFQQNSFMRKTYNPFTVVKAMQTVRKSVRSWRPDIVSVHSSFSGFIGRVALAGRVPVVYTTHGWGFTYRNKAFKPLTVFAEKIAGVFCDKIICVSKRDYAVALRYRIAPQRKLVHIYNGVDTSGIRAEKSNGFVTIGFVGRMAPPKRQDLLLDAFAMLPHALRAKASIVYVGDGPQKQNVQKQTVALGMGERVQFLGALPREQAMQALSACSIAVLLSESEGFPLSVIEALQLGVPVLANAVGGIPEAIDTRVGRLLPPDPDVEAISNALAELIGNDALRHELSQNAVEKGMHFSAREMSKETRELYCSIIDSHTSKC